MTESAILLDLVIECSGMVLCGMAMLLLFMGPRIEKRIKGYFHWYFVGCLAFSGANVAGLLMRGLPGNGWRAALYISNYMEFLLSNLIVYIISHYLLSAVDREGRMRGLRRSMLALVGLHVVLLTVSQFTGLYYVIGPDNLYRRQPLYPFCFFATGIMLLVDLALVFRHRERLTRNEFKVFLICTIAPPFQSSSKSSNTASILSSFPLFSRAW